MSFEQFEKQADKWWEQDGPFSLLHKLNPIRLRYIKDHIKKPLKDVQAIDIGCGGGTMTIPMSRMGMQVCGLDPGEENIKVARKMSAAAGLNIKYYSQHLDELSSSPEHCEQYDVVTCMEVVEHVPDYQLFLMHLCKLVRKEGLLFLSTINRTAISFACAILAAEYLLKYVPVGTHEWEKFLKPSEISEVVTACDFSLIDITGVKFKPFTKEWSTSENCSVNYMMCFVKKI